MICIQEIWLNQNINSAEIIARTNYEIFRQDRSQTANERRTGGGVMTLCKSKIKAHLIDINIVSLLEFVAIEVVTRTLKIVIVNVYIPPYHKLQSIKSLKELLQQIETKFPDRQLIVLGDFNMFSIGWAVDDDSLSFLSPFRTRNHQEEHNVVDLISYHGLAQILFQ